MARGAQKEYEVERILKAKVTYKQTRRIKWKFLVKWKGYNDKANTWEPIESFEESPKLIEKFWKKVDLGERDPTKAKYFSVREELVPRDDSWSDEDVEGEEDGEEKEKAGEETASSKAGTKRSAASEGSPKRKRGRPSKAEKEAREKEVKGDAGDKDAPAEEKKTNGENGDSASQRSSARLSENISKIEAINDRRLKSLSRALSTEGSASEVEGLSLKIKEASCKPPLIKRKRTYIESDEEDNALNSDAEESSHAGSLFSRDDSVEYEQEDPMKESEVPVSTLSVSRPADIAKAPELSQVMMRPEIKVNRLGRPVKPAVKIIDDPDLGKALEERVARAQARIHGQPAKQIRQTSGVESPVATTSYKPSLLTFEKGKLTTQRGKAVPTTVWDPSTSSRVMDTESTAAATSPRELLDISPIISSNTFGNVGVHEDASSRSVLQDPHVMDTTVIVGSIDESEATPAKLPTGPPPTSAELLQLSGASDDADELPDFREGEDGDEASPPADVTTGTPEVPFVRVEAATEEGPAWRRSMLFNFPTPKSILQRVTSGLANEPMSPANPRKLVIPLRLSSTAFVPVILKDISNPAVGPKMKELFQPDRLDGPPGKLFTKGLLHCVLPNCTYARIVPDEDCSEEQRHWFSKLVDELAKHGLFVVELGGKRFVLCSAMNGDALSELLLSVAHYGLRAVLMAFIPVKDIAEYENCVRQARDLQLD